MFVCLQPPRAGPPRHHGPCDHTTVGHQEGSQENDLQGSTDSTPETGQSQWRVQTVISVGVEFQELCQNLIFINMCTLLGCPQPNHQGAEKLLGLDVVDNLKILCFIWDNGFFVIERIRKYCRSSDIMN